MFVKQRLKIALVLCVCPFLCSCASLFAPEIDISVAYTQPHISPDGSSAYFIKTVSYVHAGWVTTGGFQTSNYRKTSHPEWTKFYLCQTDANGENPTVLFELPA